MKTLNELGISPAPWTASGGHWIEMNAGNTNYNEDRVFAIPDTEEAPTNARLIAAAPELYEALRILLETIDGLGFQPILDGDPLAVAVKCGQVALAKASGEEVAK